MDAKKANQTTSVISDIFEGRMQEEENTLRQLKDLLQEKQLRGDVFSLCNHFHTVVESWPKSKYFSLVLNLILDAITMVENRKRDEALTALYWYYVFLCEYEIIDVVSGLINSLGIDYTKTFSWPWIGEGIIKGRYNKIIEVKNMITVDKRERKIAIDRISINLEKAPLRTMVPTILYARGQGDVENESWLLRFVWKKHSTKGILSRMSEICGYKVPKEIISVESNARGAWIMKRINTCTSVVFHSRITIQEVEHVKEMYTIQPFNTEVMYALIHIGAKLEDGDIERMFENSVNGINSYLLLGKLLISALSVGNHGAIMLILQKIGKLAYYETILYSLDSTNFQHLSKKNSFKRSISMCLDFYDEITPQTDKNDRRLDSIRKKFKSAKYDIDLYRKMQDSLKEEKETSFLYDKKDYDALVHALSKKESISIKNAQTILKAAIQLRSPTRIILAYKALASMDPSKASFYNSEVEPFFIMYNQSEKSKSGSSNLVSQMWGIPINFLEPVDRQTALLAIPVKEIDRDDD